MPTIIDVAQEAGVSTATVSRVLNNSRSVSEETCRRVKAAIAKLDYTPNMGSRNLRRKESRVILGHASGHRHLLRRNSCRHRYPRPAGGI